MHRGGRGDARASCASPLGTPLYGGTLTGGGILCVKNPDCFSIYEVPLLCVTFGLFTKGLS